jgi:hypothetical protein
MSTTLTKSEIIADESRFQRVCSAYVGRGVLHCVSSLFWPIGQNMEAAAKLFDESYDEMCDWFQRTDWGTPVNELIAYADLDDLERIAEMVGNWDSVLAESSVPEVYELELTVDGEVETVWKSMAFDGKEYDDEDDAITAARESVIDDIRHNVSALITSDDEYREIACDFNIDPEYDDVYEHWFCTEGFASELESRGELVFGFCNMTVWARTTTGQSISLDGVIRQIVRELDDDHWVWERS